MHFKVDTIIPKKVLITIVSNVFERCISKLALHRSDVVFDIVMRRRISFSDKVQFITTTKIGHIKHNWSKLLETLSALDEMMNSSLKPNIDGNVLISLVISWI